MQSAPPSSLPLACWSRAPSSFFVLGDPQPQGLVGCGRRLCEPGLGGVLTPPSLHCTSGGLAAVRLLGTSPCQPLLAQLLARPADSHGHLLTPTHERWLGGPFRLSGPPDAPPPRSGAPIPVLCSWPACLTPTCPKPIALAPYPCNLGSWIPRALGVALPLLGGEGGRQGADR